MASMPCRANRNWSAAAVYRATSRRLLCPVTAAMTFALHPASASLRAAAFRKPWNVA